MFLSYLFSLNPPAGGAGLWWADLRLSPLTQKQCLNSHSNQSSVWVHSCLFRSTLVNTNVFSRLGGGFFSALSQRWRCLKDGASLKMSALAELQAISLLLNYPCNYKLEGLHFVCDIQSAPSLKSVLSHTHTRGGVHFNRLKTNKRYWFSYLRELEKHMHLECLGFFTGRCWEMRRLTSLLCFFFVVEYDVTNGERLQFF